MSLPGILRSSPVTHETSKGVMLQFNCGYVAQTPQNQFVLATKQRVIAVPNQASIIYLDSIQHKSPPGSALKSHIHGPPSEPAILQ